MSYKTNSRFKDFLEKKKYGFSRGLAKIFVYAYFRIRVYGLEHVPHEGAFLMLGNHQSFLDPIFFGGPISRRVRFVARATLSKGRFAKAIMNLCNTIPINRGKADLTAIKEIIRSLKAGYGVSLFPEGTRCKDGRITALKPGFAFLTRKNPCPIIPVVVEGAYECWPRHSKLPLPGEITVCYGNPIPAAEVKRLDDQELADLLTDRLRVMQNFCRKKMGRPAFDYPTLVAPKICAE